jgi:hypothetical protein
LYQVENKGPRQWTPEILKPTRIQASIAQLLEAFHVRVLRFFSIKRSGTAIIPRIPSAPSVE